MMNFSGRMTRSLLNGFLNTLRSALSDGPWKVQARSTVASSPWRQYTSEHERSRCGLQSKNLVDVISNFSGNGECRANRDDAVKPVVFRGRRLENRSDPKISRSSAGRRTCSGCRLLWRAVYDAAISNIDALIVIGLQNEADVQNCHAVRPAHGPVPSRTGDCTLEPRTFKRAVQDWDDVVRTCRYRGCGLGDEVHEKHGSQRFDGRRGLRLRAELRQSCNCGKLHQLAPRESRESSHHLFTCWVSLAGFDLLDTGTSVRCSSNVPKARGDLIRGLEPGGPGNRKHTGREVTDTPARSPVPGVDAIRP